MHIPVHKRYDRVFLHDRIPNSSLTQIREARTHLHMLCQQSLSKDIPLEERIAATLQEERDKQILELCKHMGEPCFIFIDKFVKKTFNSKIRLTSAKLLKLLASDAPVSSVIPLRFIPSLNDICSRPMHVIVNSSFAAIYLFCPELANLLQVTMEIEELEDKPIVIDFVKYLSNFVSSLHQNDRPTPNTCIISNSYNPSTGTAYYFSPHGNQIRELPHFNISGSGNLYDDKPANTCNKKFPGISFGGFGYIFLWFCPLHGHCYGYHLISGGEGRKDPFASLYKYLEEPPEELFYDFACGLQEYCLNRCPDFFKNTRFWHDVFHGFSHKCSPSLKSSRIPALCTVNTEICEQFNSYIQSIKYTATHLSHEHFCFFLQFFIHRWNIRKSEKYKNIYDVAVSGCL